VKKRIAVLLLAALVSLCVHAAHAQQARTHRIGVVLEGGDEATIEGLRDGLKELGLSEPRDYTLDVRNLKGDPNAAEAAASGSELSTFPGQPRS